MDCWLFRIIIGMWSKLYHYLIWYPRLRHPGSFLHGQQGRVLWSARCYGQHAIGRLDQERWLRHPFSPRWFMPSTTLNTLFILVLPSSHSLSPSLSPQISLSLPPPVKSIHQLCFRESIFHWCDGGNRSLEPISRGYLSENRAGNFRTSSLSSHYCSARPSGWYVI